MLIELIMGAPIYQITPGQILDNAMQQKLRSQDRKSLMTQNQAGNREKHLFEANNEALQKKKKMLIFAYFQKLELLDHNFKQV